MNIRQLEAFSLVMKTGNVSVAAQHLQISQPSVTRLLTELETSIDLKLFDRGQGKLRIRPEALAFYEGVEKTFLGTDYLRRVAADMRNYIGLHLRVTAFPAFGMGIMPGVIGPFHRDFPQVGISLNIETTRVLIDAIAAGTEDIGVIAGNPTPAGFDVIGQYHAPCLAIVRRDDPLAQAQAVNLSSCDQRTMVWLRSHTELESLTRRTIKSASATARGSIEVNLVDTACQLVALGQGIAIIDPITALSFENADVVLRPIDPFMRFEYTLVRSKKMNATAAGNSFCERLQAECERVQSACNALGSS